MKITTESAHGAVRDLEGKVALVTGAGRGIGRGCAEALAEAGAYVLAVARTGADLDSLADAWPGRIEGWAMDITDEAFYARIEQQAHLDILVNNAGTNRPQPFIEVDSSTLSAMVQLNVEAAFRTAQSSARVMERRATGGVILNMSSQMGHVGSPGRTVYCMTKHAIEGLTKAMAVELAPGNIRVNALAPTFIDTPLTRPMLDNRDFRRFVLDRIPLGRVARVGDIAAAVLFLSSAGAGMITGESLRIDGGWTAQ